VVSELSQIPNGGQEKGNSDLQQTLGHKKAPRSVPSSFRRGEKVTLKFESCYCLKGPTLGLRLEGIVARANYNAKHLWDGVPGGDCRGGGRGSREEKGESACSPACGLRKDVISTLARREIFDVTGVGAAKNTGWGDKCCGKALSAGRRLLNVVRWFLPRQRMASWVCSFKVEGEFLKQGAGEGGDREGGRGGADTGGAGQKIW